MDYIAVYGGGISRSVFLDDIRGDDESGQIGYSGIDERYVARSSVRSLFSGITALIVGICPVVLIAAVALTMIKWTRPYGMAVAMFMFFAGVMFSLRFPVKTGLNHADGRRGYRMVQDETYGREVKGIREGYAAEAMDVDGEGCSNEVRYTDGEENPKGNSTCGKPDPNEAALAPINPEYQFWLSIPGTEIDYPVVQHGDNRYYLNRSFYQGQHIPGCVFASSPAVPLTVDNTVLYGHGMKDESIFADLKKYGEGVFSRENPIIRVFYRGEWLEYPIFSCQLRHQSDAGTYGTNFVEGEWLPYLEKVGAAPLHGTEVIPEGGEKLITPSTCYGRDQYLIV